MNTELSHSEAIDLLPSAMLTIARRQGIHALAIKGQALTDQGIRSPRRSTDIDILVNPASFEQFRAQLHEVFWSDRDHGILAPLGDRVTALAPHSVTLLHPDFPISVDLHRYYPGFLARAQDVFDELWAYRRASTIGHLVCETLQPQDHWLLATLHVLRSHDVQQLGELRAWLDNRSGEELAALSARAHKLGASEPLREEFARIGVHQPPPDASVASAVAEWSLVTSRAPVADLIMLSEALAAPGQRLRLLWRAVFPPESSFRLFNEIAPGRTALHLAYLKRIGRGISRLPRMISYARAGR